MIAGLIFIAFFVAVTIPGWPLGWWLFGRRHAAGWVAGALIGYALTAFVWSLVIRAGLHSAIAFLVAWLALAVATFVSGRGRDPLVTPPSWTRKDTRALCLVLLLVPALVALPFARIGARDAEGSRAYRAYFTADFLWHVALASELARWSMPPKNPYLASQALHYYWLYFVPPAVIASDGGPIDVEPALALNAACSGLLFLAAITLTAMLMTGRRGAAAAAVALTVVAASAEGACALWDLWRSGRPLAGVADLNIDAITAWTFGGLRVDGLPRSLWWVPQHAAACALGLVGVWVGAAGGVAVSLAAIVLAGLALGASVAFSPLLGAAFCALYGVAVMTDAVRKREMIDLVRHGVAAAIIGLTLAWCAWNAMFEGGTAALAFGLVPAGRKAPIASLLFSFGPLLVPLLLGLLPRRERAPATIAPAVAGLALGLFLMFFVSLGELDPAWVSFRAGQLVLVTAPALIARGLTRIGQTMGAATAAAFYALLLLVGAPTTIIDVYNAQDVTNRRMGPGFRWTIAISPHQQAAFRWIRAATDPDAVVQMEPTSRGRETWTLVPSFARRRMAAGLPISLLNTRQYARLSARVRELYATADASAAHDLARQLGIEYVYIDSTERAAFDAAALAKFDKHPELFARVYQNPDVAVYAVR